MKTLYTAHATTLAGREGHTATDDGKITLNLTPAGATGEGTNPEQLFACAYSACFGSAIGAVAKKRQVAPGEIKVKADVALNMDDEGGYFLTVVLNVSLGGVDSDVAHELVEAAHQICPYSKATRGNIEVKLKVDGHSHRSVAA